MSNASREVPIPVRVRVPGSRQGIEELFKEGNEEVGLDHYQVRSWTGWAPHVTLSLLALWFLQVEKQRLQQRNPALTASLIRKIFTELLRRPPPTTQRIAEVISAVRHRSEESRIYAPYHQTKRIPPPRVPDIQLYEHDP